ncbi:MAG: DUF4255 domain-containing protein [Alcanivoracaceae bacterium]|nr:DUF4255 domain-containing protein [Alcanivoracaceae bacterium]
MALPATSLAIICSEIRRKIEEINPPTPDGSWMNELDVVIGAPGANLKGVEKNTLNLFYYRFEPFGFHADAIPGETQWIKVFCIITAIGMADDNNNISAGSNELRMLSQVMRYFQEYPVQKIEGDSEWWHVQFIPRPLADEQINQIWSTQGDLIYRPSVVYEIALAPIEPSKQAPQAARVASIGHIAGIDMSKQHSSWQEAQRQTWFPLVPSMAVDISNPQWAPAIVMVTGADKNRQASLTLSREVTANGAVSIPDLDIWLAGDVSDALNFVGQLLQNGSWKDISIANNQFADVETLDMNSLPLSGNGNINFKLNQQHWIDFDDTGNNWQLQLFAERTITINNVEVRIRSNPVLITLSREASN